MTALRYEGAEVVANRAVGGIVYLTLVAPTLAERARPGQFVMVRVGELARADLAARPFWVHAVTPAGEYGGTVELVVDPRDSALRWVAGRGPGDELRVLGPLGVPARLPAEPLAVTLVGVGTGQVPLGWLARELRAKGCAVRAALAPGPGRGLVGARELRGSCDEVVVVTDAAELALAVSDLVYVVGSPRWAAPFVRAAQAGGAAVMALLEPPMPCGTGLCLGCRVPSIRTDGEPLRACLDGPTVPASQVDWAWVGVKSPVVVNRTGESGDSVF